MRADLFHRVLSSGKEIASTDIQESGLRSVAAEQVERDAVACDVLTYLKAQVYDADTGLNLNEDVCRQLKLLGLVSEKSITHAPRRHANVDDISSKFIQEYDLYLRSQPYNMSPSEAIRTFGSDLVKSTTNLRELAEAEVLKWCNDQRMTIETHYSEKSVVQAHTAALSEKVKPFQSMEGVEKTSNSRTLRPRPRWPKSIAFSSSSDDDEKHEGEASRQMTNVFPPQDKGFTFSDVAKTERGKARQRHSRVKQLKDNINALLYN
uniref:Uncharacterized protein n=1 Tax=Hanusia phi TaxID=3032 RepID=A0A7S0NBH3_9CRYP